MPYKRSHPAPKNHEQAKSKTPLWYLCPCPAGHCSGKACGDQSDAKAHSSEGAVRKCQAHYLTRVLGYKKLNNREYEKPDGTVLVLNRRPQRSKAGKEGRPMRTGMERVTSQ
jgi:hypothetical protein